MKLKVNIREFIEGNADHNGELQVSAAIHLDDLLYGIDEEEEIDVDLDELLTENRRIAHVWGIDDVRQCRPDLDDDQAWAVLQEVAKRLHYDVGITWDVVETVARELYPEKPERHWQGRIDIRITDTDGYGQGEVINRLRDMAERLAKDMPDVEADVDPGSVRLDNTDETPNR